MLPNWLYGKSKSKLAELLGGGGAPSDYNQVKAQVTQNTEDIASLGDTKAALTQITNPNLLDNPWFTVNQRGQSSYTELNKYTVDRWRTEGNSADFSIDIVSDGVQLKRNVSEGYFALSELKESTLLTPDKKYTLSILYSDGTVKSNTFTVPAYEQSYLRIASTQSHMGCQAIIDRAASGNYNTFVLYDGDISVSPTIRALKLEVGEISTLAMDPRPEYALELAKCQRYFQRIKNKKTDGDMIALAIPSTASYLKFMLSAVPMRANPTMSPSNLSDIKYSATDYAGGVEVTSLITNPSLAGNNLGCGVGASSVTLGDIYKIYLAPSGYIDLSAEL